MSAQFLRRLSLVTSTAKTALELAACHIQFRVRQWDIQTPNALFARIYNLSEETTRRVQDEFSRVTMQAGYEGGAFGVIFDGTIIQPRRGRENATDTYLEIVAADGDQAYNFAIANFSLAAGATPEGRRKALVGAMAQYGVTSGYSPDLAGNPLPRGKVLHGMAADHMRTLADSTGTSWQIQHGQMQMVPLTGYLPDPPVVMTAATGMIGLPEQTQDGIKVRCLLNPELKIGRRIQIDNKSIQLAQLNPSLEGTLDFANLQSFVRVTDDGVYKAIVLEHTGDSRGNDWYSDIICIAVDDSAPPSLVAKGYG